MVYKNTYFIDGKRKYGKINQLQGFVAGDKFYIGNFKFVNSISSFSTYKK